MGLNARRVYFDTCVAIYYVERHPTLFLNVMRALFPPSGGSAAPVISELTRLECRVYPLRQGDHDLLRRYDAFFALRDVQYAPIDRTVFELATTLRANHGLKTPDALHLAAAVTAGCEEFWTNDSRFSGAATDRIRIVIFNQNE